MASTTSLLMSSITPKSHTFSKLHTSFFLSKPTSSNTVSFPTSTRRVDPLSTRFVRNVAVSNEYGQQEREQQFSPDLKLFVGNLPFNVDSSELAGLFGNAGTVEMVEVIYDKITGRSRGFGFVTMSSAEEVKAAAEQFNGYELDGRPLRVNAGPPPPKRDDFSPRSGGRSFDNNNRLHVSNLSWEVDDSSLKQLFSEKGNVVEAKVIYDRDSGRSRGFGFVTYGSAEEVNSAIESLDGVDFNGRSIRVTVAESKPRRF
ncbi:RNA-binding protein CP29B, chloroplastic-like [Silene latifolia]|uniref:RNA-binding protein CP29B, chloroplastic-like n=1 Tax=Silene latifolia TaxID=37657 RepID=UPI003D7834F0